LYDKIDAEFKQTETQELGWSPFLSI
jgi:hypothetical protein